MSGGGGSKSSNTVKDTPEQRHAAQVAAEKWNFAQTTLAPLENEYMDRVEDMTSPERMSYLRGRTNLNTQNMLSDGLQSVDQQMGMAGLNPNSGRWNATETDLAQGAAQVGGDQAGRAQFEQQTQQVRGLQNVAAIGAGQAGEAQVGLGRIADQSAADARSSAANSFNRKSANLQLLGSLAGAGANYGLNAFGGGGQGAFSQPAPGLPSFNGGFGLSTNATSGLRYGG